MFLTLSLSPPLPPSPSEETGMELTEVVDDDLEDILVNTFLALLTSEIGY